MYCMKFPYSVHVVCNILETSNYNAQPGQLCRAHAVSVCSVEPTLHSLNNIAQSAMQAQCVGGYVI